MASRSKSSHPEDPVWSLVIDKKMPRPIAEKLFGTDINAPRRRVRLLNDAEEATRLLKTKRASLGKNVSHRLRAALIIDHLARNSIDSDAGNSQMYFRTSIPVDDLAFMAGVNKKQVAPPQTLLNSYLESTAVGKKKKAAMKRSMGEAPDSGSRYSEAQDVHDSSSRLRDTSLINTLSIQLAAYICDADFVSTLSSRILSELIESGGSSSARATKRRRFTKQTLLMDINRNTEYYQAVCFYLAVKESEGSLGDPSSGSSKKTSKAVAQESNGDELDEESTSSLSEAMVTQTANLLQSEFSTVLEFVSEWMQELPIDLARDIRDGGSGGRSAKILPIFKTEAAATQISEFEMWRDKVLGDVKKSTLEKMKDSGNDVEEQWLDVAADEVLQRLQQRKA